MRDQVYNFLTNLITLILIVLAFLLPLLFLNIFTDFYDMPKLALLVPTTIILMGLWILSWVVRGKIVIARTPLDIPLLILLVTILASTYLSTSRYASIYGIFPDVHGSAVSWVTYILLYFVTVSNLRKLSHVKVFLYALYGSATILALISILSYFRLFLPFEMAQGVNFTPTGSTFSTTAMLLMLLPLSLFSLVDHNKYMPWGIAVAFSILFGVTIALIGSSAIHLILVLLFVGVLIIAGNQLSKRNLPFLLVPLLLSAVSLILVHVSFPGNAVNSIRSDFPLEVQLPAGISWKISASAFRDAPFVGTGPSTFLYNFTNYKPAEFNQLDFWNFNFGSAHNEFLQALGTWGLLGLLSLMVISVVIAAVSWRYLFANKEQLKHENDDTHVIVPSLAVSGILAVVLMLIHATTLVFVVTMFFLIAAFMMSQKPIREKVKEYSFGLNISTSNNAQFDLLPIMILVIFLIAASPVSARTYNAIAADYYHRLALSQADQDGTLTYEYLQQAEVLNPYIDLYRVDMAQTNFALANSLAAQKGPTEENPEGTLTDEDRQTIQTLISQAINEGRASVVIAPRSARNWEVLASLYRNISGVAENAVTFSLDAYGRAIQMDPLNPALRVNVGSLYYATGNYDLAVRFFSDAVNLKPDYANGYYNLAIALREKGDLQNAQMMADQAVRLLQQDYGSSPEAMREVRVQDLNVASELLNQITEEINIGAQTEEDSALQNPDLPSIDVPNLDNPPDTELPPAVEENPEAALPELTPQEFEQQTPTPGE